MSIYQAIQETFDLRPDLQYVFVMDEKNFFFDETMLNGQTYEVVEKLGRGDVALRCPEPEVTEVEETEEPEELEAEETEETEETKTEETEAEKTLEQIKSLAAGASLDTPAPAKNKGGRPKKAA